ncbi:hypothetical protein A3850_005975 [Lewinella sp. 4G2]|nr:hypothetical protein A3850_005975 [Lewinella sp. 4G2]
MAQTGLLAQTLDASNAPVVGDSWRAAFLATSFGRDVVGLPTPGETNATFDFRYLGNEAVLEDGTTLLMAPLDSLVSIRIFDVPTAADFGAGEVVPDFPDGAVGTDDGIFEIAFRNLDDDNFEASFLNTLEDGVYGIGFGCVEDGEYFDAITFPEDSLVVLPFGLEVGDTLLQESRDTTVVVAGDTTFETRIVRFEVLSTGTLRTHEQDYANAVALRVFSFAETRESFGFFSTTTDNINFYVPNSFAPLVSLFLDEEVDDDGELVDPTVQIITYLPTSLSSTAAVEREQFQLTAYPNPVTDGVTVEFNSQLAGGATVNLLSTDGRLVASREYEGLVAGVTSLRFDVPARVGKGTYLLQIEQGGMTTARTVIVQR